MDIKVSNLRIINLRIKNQKVNKEVANKNASLVTSVNEKIAILLTLREKMARRRGISKCKTLKEGLVLMDFQEACFPKLRNLIKVPRSLVNLGQLAKSLPKVLALGSTKRQLNFNNTNFKPHTNKNSNSNIILNNRSLMESHSNKLTAMRSKKEVICANILKTANVKWSTANQSIFSVE